VSRVARGAAVAAAASPPSPVTAARTQTRRRAALVIGSVVVALLAAAAVELLAGDYPLTPARVIDAALGGGSRIDQYIVLQVRMPRLLMAALCGAALGTAGALFQSLLRNPLASPDLLGISGGASVAAVWGTLVLGLSGVAVAGLAFAGGVAVAFVLLLAAHRLSGGGYRLVLAGVGIAFLCSAIVGYLLKRVQVQQAQSAMVWITGAIGAPAWGDILVLAVVCVLAVPALAAAGRMLPVLQLGDALAAGLGARPVAGRVVVISAAVLLSATTTAFIGPVAFVALCAPPIARALLGRGAVGIGTSAAVGAVILVLADLAGQYAIPGLSVPIGVVTGAVGAPYLLWLLATSKGRRI
jgi:iron complex transport system permease protein